MGVSINPTLSSNFKVYPAPSGPQGLVSNVIPPEGEFCVPMQFNFQNTKVWQIDLGITFGSKNSQMRSFYLDATQSSHDFTVYFPDTGFTADCKAGYSNLISLPNRRYQYVFYLSLAGQVNDPNDVVNVIATNVMLPPFNTFNLFRPPVRQVFNHNGINFAVGDLGHATGGIIFPFNLVGNVDLNTTPILVKQINMQILLAGENPAVFATPLLQMVLTLKDLVSGEIFRSYNLNSSGTIISGNGNATLDYFFISENINRIFKGPLNSIGFRIDLTTTKGVVWGSATSLNASAVFSPV